MLISFLRLFLDLEYLNKMNYKAPKIIEFKKIGEPSLGYISVAEVEEYVPFDIKRVYWTYFTPDHVQRGGHAHKQLEQILIAVSGNIKIHLKDQEENEAVFELNKPDAGLYIPKGYWRDISFSHNAVLVCIASKVYDEDDYIRDYTEFIK